MFSAIFERVDLKSMYRLLTKRDIQLLPFFCNPGAAKRCQIGSGSETLDGKLTLVVDISQK